MTHEIWETKVNRYLWKHDSISDVVGCRRVSDSSWKWNCPVVDFQKKISKNNVQPVPNLVGRRGLLSRTCYRPSVVSGKMFGL